MTYDENGNLTNDGTRSYEYDGENRLIEVTQGGSTWNYSYDYMGRRIRKWGTGLTEQRFIYDGWNLIAETDASGTLTRRFTWGLDISGTPQGAGGVGGLLMIQDGSATYYPLYDASHNVIGLYNSSGGVDSAYEYDPFGKLQTSAGIYAAANPFRYSTKYTDNETSLTYYGYRYYSSTLGRFINRDPLQEAGGHNLYRFSGNDGVNRYDYLGLDDETIVLDPFNVVAGGTGGYTSFNAMNSLNFAASFSVFSLLPASFAPTLFVTPITPVSVAPKKPAKPDNKAICDYLYKQMEATFKRFDGQESMALLRRGLMADMGGSRSVVGAFLREAGKDLVENLMIGPGANQLSRSSSEAVRELGLGLGMAYNSVNASYEVGSNFAGGDYVEGTAEGISNVAAATQYAGRLYGAGRWATRSIPGVALYEWGKVGVKGGIASIGAKWHNDQFNRLSSSFQDSIGGMDLELGTMDNLMGLLKKHGCK